jgi:hypothetical protein
VAGPSLHLELRILAKRQPSGSVSRVTKSTIDSTVSAKGRSPDRFARTGGKHGLAISREDGAGELILATKLPIEPRLRDPRAATGLVQRHTVDAVAPVVVHRDVQGSLTVEGL